MIGQPVLQNYAYSPTIGLLTRYSRTIPERLTNQARDRVQTFSANTAIDEPYTKHPTRLKQCCSPECYHKTKLVRPVTPEHTPIAGVRMTLVDTSTSIIPTPGATAILRMFMTQKTAEPVPIVRLCAIGHVKGLRWLCTKNLYEESVYCMGGF
jgi:hypothetical protein